MSTAITVHPRPATSAWLANSGLNEGEVALARAHWRSAERLVEILFATAAALGLGPDRIARGATTAPARLRHM